MLHKFVVVAQAAVIQNPVIINHDRVIHATAPCKPPGAHVFKLVHESKRSGATNLSHKSLGTQIQCRVADLFFEYRVIKVDRKGDPESIIGAQGRGFIAVLNGDIPCYANKLLGGWLFLNARGLQQIHEGTRRSVHDWDFGGVDINVGVVDTQPTQRRE